MAFVTGEVVPDPHGTRTFRVIFKHGKDIIANWPVHSEAEGQKQIIEALQELNKRHDEEGEIR